jgi:hypothetical protein
VGYKLQHMEYSSDMRARTQQDVELSTLELSTFTGAHLQSAYLVGTHQASTVYLYPSGRSPT